MSLQYSFKDACALQAMACAPTSSSWSGDCHRGHAATRRDVNTMSWTPSFSRPVMIYVQLQAYILLSENACLTFVRYISPFPRRLDHRSPTIATTSQLLCVLPSRRSLVTFLTTAILRFLALYQRGADRECSRTRELLGWSIGCHADCESNEFD